MVRNGALTAFVPRKRVVGKAAADARNRRRWQVLPSPHRRGDESLSYSVPGASGGVPDMKDFDRIPGNAVEYFIAVAPIWLFCLSALAA